jgi:hypothetical protein
VEVFDMDLQAFLAAISADWITLMSGIASVILLIAGVARGWEKVPRWAFWTMAALCFFFASARVWTVEHRSAEDARSETGHIQKRLDELTKPEFELTWTAATIGEGDFEEGRHKIRLTSSYIQIAVLNHGAPSVIKECKGSVRLTDGTELEGKLLLSSRNLTVNQWVGRTKLPMSPSLISGWSSVPIPTGGRGVGSVIFMFPAGTKTKADGPGGVLIFKIVDIEGREYKIEAPWQKSQTPDFGSMVPALPGMTN